MSSSERVAGTVKWFDPDKKGYGFIARKDGKPDVFVHVSDVRKSGVDLNNFGEGDDVTFNVETGQRGTKATELLLA